MKWSKTQEVDNLKEILNDWDEIAKFDLDAMVLRDILPSYQELMDYKEETLRKWVTKLQTALEIV